MIVKLYKTLLLPNQSLLWYFKDDWERVSIILTPSHIVVTQDFFQWLFTSKEKELEIKLVEKIEKLEGLVWFV